MTKHDEDIEGLFVIQFEPGKKPESLMEISINELQTIEQSRGDAVESTGFSITKLETEKEEIDLKGFKALPFPLPQYTTEKTWGPFKKLKTVIPEPEKIVYTNTSGETYLEDLIEKKFYQYITEQVYPSQREIIDYKLERIGYMQFLEKNEMELDMGGGDDLVNTPRIIDKWGELASGISEEQRTSFVIARWIAAQIYMPDIFSRIENYLKLGHAVDDKLIKKQAETLVKSVRNEREDEEGGIFKNPFKK